MPELLDSTRLLFDLHRGAEIAQSFSGLEPEAIALQLTDGLVEKFDCAFARIWLLEPNQQFLKLVASSGMYTHINGKFSRVPLGAYKVGKIAQNRVSFLSNNLAEEHWVGNREWAIANKIRGFAGYPLEIRGKVVGVLASFSHQPLAPEFLEILPTLCTMVSIALDAALQHQREKQTWQTSFPTPSFSHSPLSDQLAHILSSARLTLVGTEQTLTLPFTYVFLQAAETLNRIGCAYCRLIYTASSVALEAIVPAPNLTAQQYGNWIQSAFGELLFAVSCLGGKLNTQTGGSQGGIQVSIEIPYPSCKFGLSLRIRCKRSVLQMAFTHLAFLAGLTICDTADDTIPLLTDDITQINTAKQVLWIQQDHQTLPKGIQAKVDLSIAADRLRDAVDAVTRGESWGIDPVKELPPPLSERELEMMRLLVRGLRDRDIANHLIISESTVKFHINNILSKLKAKTRFQALHQVMVNGWLE
ncbi:LuxR C-terminal-related transcriptional regulator [Tumidithrix elongata RA019]|uniref:LuxR C-terminal-related transcriptional regulator n=1 Tax=Tumidithrix elongata BACA0141 TaxID=2716417 RepID=A0AAW9Q102_9CYAN|nr:LuxR C-terminal-related transcriptional regulator [Tumidithrix elongata RA019]